jgi:hypothetical protein
MAMLLAAAESVLRTAWADFRENATMIVFNLRCRDGHTFEEWFASSREFQSKADAQALRCPECGDAHIEKGISAPRVNGGAAAAPAVGPCGLPQCGAGVCQMRD